MARNGQIKCLPKKAKKIQHTAFLPATPRQTSASDSLLAMAMGNFSRQKSARGERIVWRALSCSLGCEGPQRDTAWGRRPAPWAGKGEGRPRPGAGLLAGRPGEGVQAEVPQRPVGPLVHHAELPHVPVPRRPLPQNWGGDLWPLGWPHHGPRWEGGRQQLTRLLV